MDIADFNKRLADSTREPNESVFNQAAAASAVDDTLGTDFDQDKLASEKAKETASDTLPESAQDTFEKTFKPEPEAEIQDPQEKEREPRESSHRIARRYINIISLGLGTSARLLYPRALITDAQADLNATLKAKVEAASPRKKAQIVNDAIDSEPAMAEAYNNFLRVQKLVDQAPLSDEEKKDLLEPLAECVEKYRFMQIGPEFSLLMAVVVIMAPRIAPFFGNPVVSFLNGKAAE